MSNRLPRPLAALACTILLTAAATAPAQAQQAQAVLIAQDGSRIGTIDFRETPDGVLLTYRIDALSPGAHATHIHEIGTCIGPDFTSAGGHYSPDGQSHGGGHGHGGGHAHGDGNAHGGGHGHGAHNSAAKHAGDLPNLEVKADGTLTVDILADAVSLNDGGPRAPLFDADGSAVIIHAGPDDYIAGPTGADAVRVACGVIVPGK
jgi:superoxide dismutase, Cu-Zn family